MQRLSPLDAEFLRKDTAAVPRQIASLAVLAPGAPLDHDQLIKVVSERIDLVPRYRQIPRRVPAALGSPVWIDDEDFDIALHVRRSALPRPGSREALHELVGRLVARRLDQERPLWELYLIEGLSDGAVALLFKAHQALVDGSDTIDLAQVLLDETPRQRDIPHEDWTPRPTPGSLDLIASTVAGNVRRPSEALRTTERNLVRLARQLPIVNGQPPPTRGVLSAELTRHRRFSSLSANLEQFRKIREQHGGTVNDAILTCIAGGLRGWMLTRAESVTPTTSFRAMVPMSVHADHGMPTSMGSHVSGHLLSLPVGETNPVVRLHQVSYALKDHRETGMAVAANDLTSLPGFATPTFHAVGARVASSEAGRGHHIVISNVPGPQDPVYMAGHPVAEIYPAIPLNGHRALAIGVTSYRGTVFFGIVADREAVPDVDVLAQCIQDAIDELVDAMKATRRRAPRGRNRPAT